MKGAWNGNFLTIRNCGGDILAAGYTLGASQTEGNFTACVQHYNEDGTHGAYWITVDGGGPSDDLSWTVSQDGRVIAQGGAPFGGGTCSKPPSSLADDDNIPSCVSPCQGFDCDHYNRKFGLLENTCDYYGAELEALNICDCSGCACETGGDVACELAYTLALSDSAGDGWAGGKWYWSTSKGVLIEEGTLEMGGESTYDLCAFGSTFDCYKLEVSAGTWPSEQSWTILDESQDNVSSGGAPGSASLCTDHLCTKVRFNAL